jgi:hypothetical protein
MTSSVPQGSVISSLSFFIYINDLSSRVKSRIRLFAENSLIYCKISEDANVEILSSDLNNINLWCQEWGLKLNLSKCKSVHLLQKLSNHRHTYTVNGINIKTSEEVTYLGVTITSDISHGKHIRNINSVALKKLGFIKYILKVHIQKRERKMLFCFS